MKNKKVTIIDDITSPTLLESSKKMYNETLNQTSEKGVALDKKLKNAYTVDKSLLRFPYELRNNNRWVIEFPKNANISKYLGAQVTLPKYPFNVGGEITVILRDSIQPSTTENLLKLSEKVKPFKLEIHQLDPIGDIIAKWILKGCFITNIEWSTLDYNDKNPCTVNSKISYKEVKYKI